MATKSSDTTKAPGKPPNTGSLLDGFMAGVEEYARTLSAGAIEAATDDETRALLETTTAGWVGQLDRLIQFTRDHHGRMNVAQRAEVEDFLRVQDGMTLVQRGMETTRSAFRGGWFKRFLKWMIRWFKEIKKVLKEIVALILDALGIDFPKWLETIFLLLDELHDAIAELLADVFGLDSSRFAAEAARAEVAYLSQLEALERLRQLRGKPADNRDN